jgi:hypothetical protein
MAGLSRLGFGFPNYVFRRALRDRIFNGASVSKKNPIFSKNRIFNGASYNSSSFLIRRVVHRIAAR